MESIRQFFAEHMAPATNGQTNGQAHVDAEDERQKLHVAACALLLEIAYADEAFSDAERAHIEAVMERHFNLDSETVAGLIELAEAERSNAIDLYQFTSLIRDNYDLGQKTLLAEIMWGLVLTDGEVQRHESYMLRKIANLLDLKAGYLASARNRAAAQLE